MTPNNNQNKFNWISTETIKINKLSSLKLSADTDFLAVIRLWESGLIQSPTYVCLAQNAIKQYCLNIVLSKHPDLNPIIFENKLLFLWSETNKYLKHYRNHKQFAAFIKEMDAVMIHLKTNMCEVNLTSNFLAMFVIICTALRFEILGKFDYSGLNYGINQSLFIPIPCEDTIPQEQKIYKMLHLILNHNVTFSHLSIPEEFSWEKIDFDTTQLLLNNDFYNCCPWCSGFVGIGLKSSIKLREFLNSNEQK